jgi:hypothetical protein
MPERFGPWKSVHNRFANWANRHALLEDRAQPRAHAGRLRLAVARTELEIANTMTGSDIAWKRRSDVGRRMLMGAALCSPRSLRPPEHSIGWLRARVSSEPAETASPPQTPVSSVLFGRTGAPRLRPQKQARPRSAEPIEPRHGAKTSEQTEYFSMHWTALHSAASTATPTTLPGATTFTRSCPAPCLRKN